MSINFAMYRGVCVCVYVEKRIFLVKDNSEKEKGQLVLAYIWMCAVCLSSGVSNSLNLLVIQAHFWRVCVFECVWLSSSTCIVCGRLCVASIYCLLFLWTKKLWVLILFEWIEIRYFKFTRVDFISGQLKFKCTDVRINTTCDLI